MDKYVIWLIEQIVLNQPDMVICKQCTKVTAWRTLTEDGNWEFYCQHCRYPTRQ